ncbi:2590_t:CDS:2 [Acaulospora morrowiae]|uniref:2590_t:CDS:1 n=1 Tax=Acaulospora morrowiae TaxID=94023 RepID=A0A9N9ASP0_9GLOM|nr:2590_t:CDS:2 [Acaulospora morrowiae]
MRELLLVRKLEEEQAKRKPREAPSDSASALELSDTTDSLDAEQSIQSKQPDSSQLDNNLMFSEQTHVIAEDAKHINDHETNIDTVKDVAPGESVISDDQQKSLSTIEPSIHSTHNDSLSGEVTFVDVEAVGSLKPDDGIEGTDESEDLDLTTVSSVDNENKMNGGSTELQTKRASLKEFFLHKQSFSFSKDNFTDNLALDPHLENVEVQSSSSQTLINNSTTDGNNSNNLLEKSNQVAKEQLNPEIDNNTSQVKVESSDLPPRKDSTELSKSAQESCELSPDEKRQRAAAARATQRKELRNLMRQKKMQKQSEDVDVVIMEPTNKPTANDDVQLSNDPPTVVIDSAEQEEKTSASVEQEFETIWLESRFSFSFLITIFNLHSTISRIKRSKIKSASADYDSDGSIDLDVLIAENSDLDTGSMQLNDDGLNDDDDNFWNIDTSELERHLTPSTTPLRLPSPDPQAASTMFSASRPFSMIAEEDENLSDTPLEVDGQEVDDILNTFSNSNGFNCTPILKPSSPSPVPSPFPSLSGGKPGIPVGMPKTVFASHFSPSPLSPTSSRASSVGDPDEYETMSNGSYTSVRSASSIKSGASGIRRPSTTTGLRAPSRAGSHMTVSSRITTNRVDQNTPVRPRSMSVVSNSSTEESTTSSRGATSPSRIASPTHGLHMSMYSISQSRSGTNNGRTRSMSRISNSSADDVLVRPTSNGSSNMRSLSRAGSHIGTIKSPGVVQSRIRDSMQSTSVAATKVASSARPTSQLQQSPTGLVRPSSRASLVKSPVPSTTTSGLGSFSESQKNTPIKKSRPQSIHVSNQTIKHEQSPKSNTGRNTPSGIRSPSSGLRSISYLGGRQSSDSLSSHDDYLMFTPPESPTGASETDSLTSLTSSVSYGSSPGRGTSPIPPYNTSMISPTSIIASKPSKRSSMISSPNGISRLPSAKVTPSKLMSPNSIVASQTTTGLRPPSQIGYRKTKGSKE